MAIAGDAGGAVPGTEVWLDGDGRIHRLPIRLRSRANLIDDVEEAARRMKTGERVGLAVHGPTLWKLDKLIHGGD